MPNIGNRREVQRAGISSRFDQGLYDDELGGAIRPWHDVASAKRAAPAHLAPPGSMPQAFAATTPRRHDEERRARTPQPPRRDATPNGDPRIYRPPPLIEERGGRFFAGELGHSTSERVFSRDRPTSHAYHDEKVWLRRQEFKEKLAGGDFFHRDFQTRETLMRGSPESNYIQEGRSSTHWPTLPTFFVSHGPGELLRNLDEDTPVVRTTSTLFERSRILRSDVRAILIIASSLWKPTKARNLPDVDVEVSFHADFTGGRARGRLPTGDLQGLLGGQDVQRRHLSYRPRPDPELSHRVVKLLTASGFRVGYKQDAHSQLAVDALVPFMLMNEFYMTPVICLSLPGLRESWRVFGRESIARKCLDVGAALRGLRHEGVLVVGSGSVAKARALEPQELAQWSRQLQNVCCTLSPSERESWLNHWQDLPYARQAHPSEGDLLPLHIAVGAADGEPGTCVGQFTICQTALLHFRFGEKRERTTPRPVERERWERERRERLLQEQPLPFSPRTRRA